MKCAVCGRELQFSGHRCPERVIRAIEAAHAMAGDRELESWKGEPRRVPEAYRLHEGLALMFREEPQ
jgi:hypothetical protein